MVNGIGDGLNLFFKVLFYSSFAIVPLTIVGLWTVVGWIF